MNDTDLAWAAGIMEGEGSVRIATRTVRNLGALSVSVTNIEIDMLEPLHSWFGGQIRSASTRPDCRDAWRWTVASIQADTFLAAIEPFCHVRRFVEKLRLGREYQAQKTRAHHVIRSVEYAERQQDYFERMRDLNLRGVAAAQHRNR